MKNRPSLANLVAPTSMHGDEFVELVWENGRIVMRGSARKCVSGHSDGQVHHRTDCHNGGGGGSGDRGNGGGASETGNISSVDNTIPRKDFSLSSGVSDHKWVGQDQSRIHSSAQDNDHRHRTNNLVASDDKPMSINEVPRPSSWTTRMTSRNVDHLCRHLVGQCRSSTLLEGRTNSKPSSHSKGNCVNFSLFLRPTLVLKAHDQHGTGSTTLSRDSDRSLHVEQKPNDEIHGALGNGDAFDTSLLKQPSATEGKAKPIYADPKILAKATLDEHSEAVGCNDDSTRHKKSDEKCPNRSSIVGATTSEKMTPIDKVYCKPQPVASSSVCSREASNDLSGALKRSYDDSESTNTGEDADDEDDDDSDETDTMPTITAVHNKSERRQRRRINKRMRTLQELLPNCNKVDQASVLDEAIEYLKSLQRQLQIMSTARTPLFAPPMMFPRGTQPMSTLHLNQFPPLGVELGMKIGSGTFQFPISPISQATTLLGSSGSAVPMFGVQSMPYMPFVPTVTQPIQATNNAVEHLKSAAPSAIGEAIRN